MSNNGWMVSKPCKNSESHPCPVPNTCQKEDDYSCAKYMRRALNLLFDSSIKDNVLFDEFAFIGKNFLVGTALEIDPDDNDNIFDPGATLTSINLYHSDFIKINDNSVIYPILTSDISGIKEFSMKVNRISLCNLDAIVFQYDPEATNFEVDLQKLLDKESGCNCSKDEEYGYREDIFGYIFNPYCSRDNFLNFTAGWLACKEAKILGRVGNILVLANTAFYPAVPVSRIYFVCLESIGIYSDYLD